MDKGKNNKAPLIALITALSILLVALVGFLVYYAISGTNSNKKSGNDDKQIANTAPPVINVTACPDQVSSDNPYATVSGTVVSSSSSCTLTINGEVIITSNAPGTQASWSKTYQLSAGETRTLQIEARDAENHITTLTKTIYCQQLQEKKEVKKRAPITPGCTLVKKNKNGLNIREFPGTEYRVVAYISGNDFTSEMVFTGNYQITWDNYTWYEVIAPNGKHGYVRSDLVQSNTFIN